MEATTPTVKHTFGPYPLSYLANAERIRVVAGVSTTGLMPQYTVDPASALNWYAQGHPDNFRLAVALQSRSIMQSEVRGTQLDVHASTCALATIWQPALDGVAKFPVPGELIDELLLVDDERWRRGCRNWPRTIQTGPIHIDQLSYCRTMGEKLNELAVRLWLLGQIDTFTRVTEVKGDEAAADRLTGFIDGLLGKGPML